MKYLIVFFILFSCSEEKYFSIQRELHPYYKSFIDSAKSHHVSIDKYLIFRLGKINSDNKGLYFPDTKTILIDSSFFHSHLNLKSQPDSNFVTMVCWHELGHWIGESHRPDKNSIMNTGDFLCGDFIATLRFFNESEENKNIVIEEFFKHAK